jgi:hypothetical protein
MLTAVIERPAERAESAGAPLAEALPASIGNYTPPYK